MEYILCVLLLGVILFADYSGGHQNVPPGVHPQHYQQVPMHQVPQHVPVQQQMPPGVQQQHMAPGVPMQQQHMAPGVPMQQQHMAPGVPMQQQHMAPGVPMQQQHMAPGVPVQQQHGVPVQQYQQVPVQQHHDHGGPPQVLNVANIAHEKEHIEQRLEMPIDTSKMSEQELQFHYFKLHDADNNNKLDGCELIKSLIHWHEGQPNENGKLFKDDELVSLIDPILALDDANSDGYIDYPEFVRAQQKAAAQQPKS